MDQRPGNCHICELVSAAKPAELIHRDDHWSAFAFAGVPGWVMFATNRHCDWLWGFTTEEATALGPLLSRLSAAVRNAASAERVYYAGLGENSLHFHGVLLPRTDDDLSIELALHGAMNATAVVRKDVEATVDMAARIRAALDGSPATA